ncbi:MAG: NAD(P)H-nitrite reductase [Methylophaga sp.]|nr:MAG: NAD(P)H-nitrite reductase [Methylophaga sp.]
MIVCICNNVTSATIENAVSLGADSIDDVRKDTGAASCCGKCQFQVNRIIHDLTQNYKTEQECCG